VYHKLEVCKDEKRELVATEIAKLQEIKFANGVCCKLCAVPQETCYDSTDFRGQGKEGCFDSQTMRLSSHEIAPSSNSQHLKIIYKVCKLIIINSI
jgi:hypothetical protein